MINIELLKSFDAYLGSKGLKLKASLVGGTAIMLMSNNARMTRDIDSLVKLPEDVKVAIEEFALKEKLPKNWFNDRASRNYSDFVCEDDEVFVKEVYSGRNLSLFTPSINALLLSKIHPLVDREAMDLQDIESLIDSGAVSKSDFLKAIRHFEGQIRFEDEGVIRKRMKAVAEDLKDFVDTKFAPANA